MGAYLFNKAKNMKLSSKMAREIRESAESVRELADRYRVSQAAIRDVLYGRRWPRAGGPIRKPSTNGVKWEPTPEQVEEICAALSVRGSWADGAKVAGVSVPTLKAFARRSDSGADLFLVVEDARKGRPH